MLGLRLNLPCHICKVTISKGELVENRSRVLIVRHKETVQKLPLRVMPDAF